jgi:hypothetical protein
VKKWSILSVIALLQLVVLSAHGGQPERFLFAGTDVSTEDAFGASHIQKDLTSFIVNIEDPECLRKFVLSPEFTSKSAIYGEVTRLTIQHVFDGIFNALDITIYFGNDVRNGATKTNLPEARVKCILK